jgi:cytidylate kinase
MNVITITREYGAGGGEAGRKLADALGWQVLDRELLHQAAESEHVPDAELERLDEKAIRMADRFRLHPPHQRYLHGLKAVVEQAAGRGSVILVGRGARHLLGERSGAFHLRLVAPRDWRARRMAALESWSLEQAVARCTEMDRTRDRFTRYFFGDKASQPAQYDLLVNTAMFPLDDVVAVVEAVVRGNTSSLAASVAARRVLTLSRELGAGQQGFPAALAERLGMRLFDRNLLEQEAVRMGISAQDLEKIDERPPRIFERFRPGSIYQRYFDVLRQRMHEVASQGDVIVVGRGGSRLLRDEPRALHVRLVAMPGVRVRRVMEYRWVAEAVARRLIAESDQQRRSFYENYFGADWSSPLEYHLTVNSGQLGPAAVDLVTAAAARHWSHAEQSAGSTRS